LSSPKSQGTLPDHPWDFLKIIIDSKNHMGAQMKGSDIKGSEVRVVFTAMDASSGKKRSQVASICWSQDPKIC
jgi:hypothetical protein